ncbi:hypothetical protein KC19_3G039000, partial [Ceratodon purpureus]
PATIEAPAGIPTTLKSPPPSRKVQRSSDPLVRRFKMRVQELPPQPSKKPKQGRRSYPTVPLLKQITFPHKTKKKLNASVHLCMYL